MVNETAQKKETALAPIASIDLMRSTISALAPEFKAALPPQIPVERFIRTIITTLQMNPDLLAAETRSSDSCRRERRHSRRRKPKQGRVT